MEGGGDGFSPFGALQSHSGGKGEREALSTKQKGKSPNDPIRDHCVD